MDKFSKKKRSEIMSQVKQKNTAPELVVRKLLHKMGYRFRLHRKDLPGNPDIVLPKYGVVIFVHGCFWHGHDCRRGKAPTSRQEFWSAKIDGNRRRDARVVHELEQNGYKVLVIWECEMKDQAALAERLRGFLIAEE